MADRIGSMVARSGATVSRSPSLPSCTQDCGPTPRNTAAVDSAPAPTATTTTRAGTASSRRAHRRGPSSANVQYGDALNIPAQRPTTAASVRSTDTHAVACATCKVGAASASSIAAATSRSASRPQQRPSSCHHSDFTTGSTTMMPPLSQQPGAATTTTTTTTTASEYTSAKATRRVRDALQHAELLQQQQQKQQQRHSRRGVQEDGEGGDSPVSRSAAATPTPPPFNGTRDMLLISSALGGMSGHSSSAFSLHSPPAPSACRFREGDLSAIIGSVTPSSNMTNTLSSRTGMNVVPDRTPPVGFLPGNSRISTHEEGGSVMSDQYPHVSLHAALSLLHLEADESCAGRSGTARLPLPRLPPRARSSTTSCNAAMVVTVPATSEEGQERSTTPVTGSWSPTSGASLTTPCPPHPDRHSSIGGGRRSRCCFNGSSNAYDLLMVLGGSASNLADAGLSGVSPSRPANRSGPRGRRSKSGAMVGSLTSFVAGPCTSGSVNGPYGVSLLMDGTLLQSRGFPSSSSGPTTSHTGLSGGSYLTDTNTWLTNGSSANSLSATVAANAAGSPRLVRPSSTTRVTGTPAMTFATPSRQPSVLPMSEVGVNGEWVSCGGGGGGGEGGTPGLPPPRGRRSESRHRRASTYASSPNTADLATLTASLSASDNVDSSVAALTMMTEDAPTAAAAAVVAKAAAAALPTAPPPPPSPQQLHRRSVGVAAAAPPVNTTATATSAPTAAGEPLVRVEAGSALVSPRIAPSTGSPPTLHNASISRLTSPGSTASCTPVKLVTIVLPSPCAGSVVTFPAGEMTSHDAPLPTQSTSSAAQLQHQQMLSSSLHPLPREESESETHHRNTVRWLTGESPSFRSASAGSMRSSLLFRADPRSAGSPAAAAAAAAAHGHTHHHHSLHPAQCNSMRSLLASDVPYSPRSASFQSLPATGVPVWSAEESVDLPLDACGTVTLLSSDTQKSDAPSSTTENSLSTAGSGFAGYGGAECPPLTSAWFQQLTSFSRSRASVTSGAAQRSIGGGAGFGASHRSSVPVVNLASTTNSALIRATTLVSSTTRTTTTHTTTTTMSAATAETAKAATSAAMGGATKTVTTTAVSSITCSARHIILAQRSTAGVGGAAASAAAAAASMAAVMVDSLLDDSAAVLHSVPVCDATPSVDAVMLDDPDAPPFAKAAFRRFHEQNPLKTSATRRAELRARDPATPPRRVRTESQNSVADCAVPFVVSTAAVQSCCTAHSFMAEARCINRSTANSPSTPQDSPPLPSTALVGLHGRGEEVRVDKTVIPPKPTPLCVTEGPNAMQAPVPLTAMEVHLPVFRQKAKRSSRRNMVQ